jgi:hypothetical protein
MGQTERELITLGSGIMCIADGAGSKSTCQLEELASLYAPATQRSILFYLIIRS